MQNSVEMFPEMSENKVSWVGKNLIKITGPCSWFIRLVYFKRVLRFASSEIQCMFAR
jgi:hypothetical protein